ncbi:MAG TPA: hypothetical protein VGI60_03710 [Chthoniobacterales bacterium]
MNNDSNSRFGSRAPRNQQPASIANKRWAAYAMAGAATALSANNSAEAGIHYFNIMDKTFGWPRDGKVAFQLDQPGDSFYFIHGKFSGCGEADFGIVNLSATDPRFRGFRAHDYYYVSKLTFGQKISSGSFVGYFLKGGIMAGCSFLGTYHQWEDPGMGFVGFRFRSGAGTQYGWVRVRTLGGPQNAFRVLDYAYADPGEPIAAGQTSSDKAAPDQGSLGWLALGAGGILAWRKSRSRAAN